MITSFIGTWSLTSNIYESLLDNKLFSPLGDKAYGLLIYTSEGYVSVFISQDNRIKFAIDDPMMGTLDEQCKAFSSSISYYGRFTVEEKYNTITHHIESAWFPNWNNTAQKRNYTFQDDKLILSTPAHKLNGKECIGKLIWQRMSPQDAEKSNK